MQYALCPLVNQELKGSDLETLSNYDSKWKPSSHVSWGTVGSWSAFVRGRGMPYGVWIMEDAFLRGSCGGKSEAFKYVRLYELFHRFDLRLRLQTRVMLVTLVTSFNAKLCTRTRKNFGNFNLRKRGTTTRGWCKNHFWSNADESWMDEIAVHCRVELFAELYHL